jgi:DNA-binding YbaB/EbfC family protein
MPKRRGGLGSGSSGLGGSPGLGGGAGGFGGGGGGNAGMMKQIQKMQEDMEKAQEALAQETVNTEAGGGIVKVVMTCHQRLQEINIDKSKLDFDDEEWTTDLQDLIAIAVNEAIEKSQERAAERMESITGGLSSMLPPGLLGG